MKKYNWMAQDLNGGVYKYIVKPGTTLNGTWWNSGYRLVLEADNIVRSNWKESLIDLSKNDYIIKDGILMATRKHAALIHAWADGAIIQYKFVGEWETCADDEVPEFCAKDIELRIKPATRTVKFRNWYSTDGKVYGTYCAGECNNPDFVTWLGDWREVEIEL